MVDNLLSVLMSVSVISGIAFFARKVIFEWLVQGIKHKYNKDIELLKADLVRGNNAELERLKSSFVREMSIVSASHKAFGEGLSYSQKFRVDGVAFLWNEIVNLKTYFPHIFMLVDAMLRDEFIGFFDRDFKVFDSNINKEDVERFSHSNNDIAEKHRIFVGDYLWYVFYVYKALHTRIVFLYMHDRDKGVLTPWYEDKGNVSLLSSIMTKEEMDNFNGLKLGKIDEMRRVIERKFLDTSDKVISGENIGNFAVEAAARMADAALEYNRKAEREMIGK